jgi:hypothetical protein
MKYKQLPRAKVEWAHDSGGFSELSLYSSYQTTPQTYAAAVRRYRDEVGMMLWSAPQDWMCEAFMLKNTGKSVREHQELTIANYLELMSLAPDLPWIPVLQGWTFGQYLDCVELYNKASVDLTQAHLVGVGSICRRQHTIMVEHLLHVLHEEYRLRLHGFGLKMEGIRRAVHHLQSADSMAWSAWGRRKCCPYEGRLNCANCLHWALEWRERVVDIAQKAAMKLQPA